MFKTKEDPNLTAGKKKVRLVAKGCSQRPGEDFFETYAPVARVTSIRTLAALSAELGFQIYQMDAVTAYLNVELKENCLYKYPTGLEKNDWQNIVRATCWIEQAGSAG